MQFGKQIKVMRGVRGVRQRELGSLLALSDQSKLGYIERGELMPPPDLREQIKAALKWPEPPLDELVFSILEGTIASEADLVDWLDGKAIVRVPFIDPPLMETG